MNYSLLISGEYFSLVGGKSLIATLRDNGKYMLLFGQSADGKYNLVGGDALLLSLNYPPVKVREGMDLEVQGGVIVPPQNAVAITEEEKKFLQPFAVVLELLWHS